MSKVYSLTGQRHCDGCVRELAVTKRKVGDCWYAVCGKCARAIDQQKDKKREASE